MNERTEHLLIGQVKELRADMARMADDMRNLRSELAEFRAEGLNSKAHAIRRLWDEGLAGGESSARGVSDDEPDFRAHA